MKDRIAWLMLLSLLVMAAVSPSPAVAQENGSSNPAALNTRVRSMIELGSVYTNIYDIAVTVLETVRGKEAMVRLQAANPDTKTPPAGFEYALARVKFEFKGRYVSDNIPFDLGNDPLQWVALSSELTEYPRVSVQAPKPPLAGRIKPGDSMEGWVVFAVSVKDSKPVLVFDPDTGGATGRGRTLFFKLYQ
jgi:hypothetical protein